MTGKDLFVVMYSCVWGAIITLFVFYCMLSKCMSMADAVILCNGAFLTVTSIMVFVTPVRKFVDKHIISRL